MPEIRASSPRPSTFFGTFDDLPSERPVAIRPGTLWIIEHDRLSERRCFAELYVPRNDAPVDAIGEEASGLVRHLLRQIEASVEHREQHALDSQLRVEALLNSTDR